VANAATSAPTVADIEARWGEPLVIAPKPNPDKEIIALATAVFSGVYAQCYDSHKLLAAQLSRDHPDNVWFLPTQERMPLPDAPIYAVGAMLNCERAIKQKADWFLWIDDDVSVPKDLFAMLRRSADPTDRPFVSAVAYTRQYPFHPAIWQMEEGKLRQWLAVPDHGVYEVYATGLCAALFHRSLFDKVPEPWFCTADTGLKTEKGGRVEGDRGLQPDVWWCNQLQKHGIPIHVDCTPVVTHFGSPMPINRFTAPALRQLSPFNDRNRYEREIRGHILNGQGCPVHASVRQGASEGLAEAHGDSDGTRPGDPAREPERVRGPQADAAARAELPDQLCADDDPALWRGGGDTAWWEEG